jgi:tetratricopeptide (TPR) repeat protein
MMNRFACAVWLVLAGWQVSAQPPAAKPSAKAPASSSAVDILLRKARALEGRGRLDLAAQTWRQVLVAEPTQPDALAGMARRLQQSGKPVEARDYLDKLRQSGRTAVTAPAPKVAQTGRLEEAGRLARNRQYAEALKIYREVLGDEPPPGPLAIAYYETMASAPDGWKPATAGLQSLVSHYPDYYEYRLSLGKLYSYKAESRAAGIRMLEAVPGDAARAALRQALIWDGSKPANKPALQAYLAKTPDAELQKFLDNMPKAQVSAAGAMTAAEQRGYELLNAGKLDEAQAKLEQALQDSPRSVAAMSGLGYIALKREDFAGAAEYFEVAAAAVPKDKQVQTALESARFFLHVQTATRALNENDSARAKSEFEQAVALRPNDLIAVRGLAGTELKLGDKAATLPLFERLTKAEPNNATNWRGQFEAKAAKDGAQAALDLLKKMPPAVLKTLMASMGFELTVASAYLDAGDKVETEKVVTLALAQLKADTSALTGDEKLQLAGLLLTLDRTAESETLFRDATVKTPGNPAVWEGLLSAQMKAGHEQAAYSSLISIPENTYQEGLKRSGFLRGAAVLQAKFGAPGTAEELLRKVLATPMQPQEREGALLMLASAALARGDAKQAADVASQLIEVSPQNTDGWKLLISARQTQKLSAEASETAKRIPPAALAKLQEDPDFIALMASVEDANGDTEAAMRSVKSAIERFETVHKAPPVGLQLQLGWLLLNSGGDEKALYSTLTTLRMRRDVNPEQTRAFQEIWSVWIRRRAEKARKDGDLKTQVAILDAGAKLLPKDKEIRDALAGALLGAGETRRAFNAYKGMLTGTPTAEEFAAAVGAAIKLNEPVGQQWLRIGLQRFPQEPALLELAGRQSASKGEYSKAQLYWREALAAGDIQATRKPGAVALSPNDPQRSLGTLLVGQDVILPNGEIARETPGGEAPGTFGLFPFIDQKKPKALSEQVHDELSALDGRNAPFLGGGPDIESRGGRAGFEQRTLVEGDIESSVVLGSKVRLGLTATPTEVSSGASDGSSELRLGLLPQGVAFDKLSATGIGFHGQISTETMGLWAGLTPQGFLVQNVVGGFRFRPAKGPLTITVSREPLKDTLLSYAGVRDPISNQIFGGVIANSASARVDFGNEMAGTYFGGGYQQLQGVNVEANKRYDGLAGGYRRILTRSEGDLNVGVFALGLHYDNNLRYFTFGQGGYFSPQRYFLVGVPVTWRGVWQRRLQYSLSGSVGPQSFREDDSPYFPTNALLQGRDGPFYPGLSSTGLNYNVEFRWLYQFNPNWFLGGLLNVNNARNYTAQSLSFFLRYSPKARTLGSDYWLPSVPDWRGRQPFHLD